MFSLGFPASASGKEAACQCRKCKRCRFNPLTGKIPWRKAWQPTPVFLPGESPWTEEPGRLQSMRSRRVGHVRQAHIYMYIQYVYICMYTYSLIQIEAVSKPSLSPCSQLPVLGDLSSALSSLGPFQGFPSCLAITALDVWPRFWIHASRSGRTTGSVTAGPLRLMGDGPSAGCGSESSRAGCKEPGAERQVFPGRWAPPSQAACRQGSSGTQCSL